MKRFLSFFSLLLVLVFVQQSFAQPTVRDGWPLDYSPEDGFNQLMEINPLAIGTTSGGQRIVAAGNNFGVKLFDIDGNELQSISLNGIITEPTGVNYLAGGPAIGDVDADGEVEVVVIVRSATGRGKGLVVLEIDGTVNSAFTHGYTLTGADISSFILENLDDDVAPEIVFYGGDLLHAIDNDGTELNGFPWTITNGVAYGSLATLPADYNDGTPIIFWPDGTGNIHAREIDADSDITGFPASFIGSVSNTFPGPVVIPTGDGWVVSVVTDTLLNAWDNTGNQLTGFPIIPQERGNPFTLQAADLDGDSSPELIFRYNQSDLIQAYGLDGQAITGYPVSTGTEAGRGESIACLKTASDAEGMLFTASLGPEQHDNGIFGYLGASLMTGFPVNYTTNEIISTISTVIFPPVDGVITIVQASVNGYITAYDYSITATTTGTLEWAGMYGNSGNRCYDPIPLNSDPQEGPLFVASPTTLDFETLRLDSTRTLSFTVTNNGTEAGDITALAFVDVAEGTFSHDATLPISLDPEESTTINVTWTPDAVGDLDGSITVTHSEDVNGTESTITLNGTCAVWPDLVFPTEDLEFGTIWDDDPHGTATITIENTGNGQGIIDTVTIASAYSSVITVANTFPVTVEPGATTTITLNWAPEDLGDISAGVYVFHNDPAAENGMTELTVTGSYQSDVNEELIPSEYFLSQNYPNPFNPETTIRFGLKEAGQVSLKVYNLNGQEVMSLENGYREAGNYNVSFNGKNLASGVYIYMMKVNNFTSTKKMLLIQ